MNRAWLCVGLLACAPADDDMGDTDVAGTPTVALASVVTFGQAGDDGVSSGFDLDGETTALGDASGCGVPDYVGPDGEAGIDNSFANLLPIIELLGGRALYGLVQEAVDNGELLIVIEALGWEDAQPGDCVPVNVLRASGEPVVGGHGTILPSQTFDRNLDFPSSAVECATIEDDGSLHIEGFTFRMPLRVLDETVDLTLVDGQARLTPTEDGYVGAIAGGISIEELTANITGFDAIPSELVSGVVTALDSRADLNPGPDGACTHLSVVIEFEGVSAYLFEDPPPADGE